MSTQDERELSIIRQSAQALAELVGRIGSHFRRAEVRKRAGRYLEGLLASVERKNGWQMAEALVKQCESSSIPSQDVVATRSCLLYAGRLW